MNPETQSQILLGITRSKAKMFEYNVPAEFHIKIARDPSQLMTLCIGLVGDYGKNDNIFVDEEMANDYKKKLLFSAQFFDSYIESKLHLTFSDYYLLIGAATYYLADLPGNSSVLANRFLGLPNEMNTEGIDILLIWVLQNNFAIEINFNKSIYFELLDNIYKLIKEFNSNGNNEEEIISALDSLCKLLYFEGTDRQLLFADILKSVVKKQIYNSSWKSLARYSSVNADEWKETILRPTFIREFWPAQRLLGEKSIFKGKSGIIQMPTSAGKTKSLEIIIRSSFLSKRSEMAVIIAPFRALCSEIKSNLQYAFKDEQVDINEPSDAIQVDFDFEDFDFEISKLIIVVTPEKFMYILRNSPQIINRLGLVIYDEGHQFDNGIRGVTYELLLSSLKNKVSKNTQIILISAVISNADSIGDWLIEGDKEIISSSSIFPNYRTIAFASWTTPQGMLQFVKSDSPDDIEYYVPRVLHQTLLALKGRERNIRHFPEKSDGKEISLFLAFKLIPNGTVAIFCGSKSTVKSLYEQTVDLNSRGYDVSTPLSCSNKEEVHKLTLLHKKHFGDESKIAEAANLGVFTHSGNTPEGLRLAIEYSLQTEKIKFVICTSTLAQGVNLPIKYLLITSFYQAGQKIKIRDFHNLIGRAGRSGMHTEGSIIFTDTELFDKKNIYGDRWKWFQAKSLLDPNNSEPCGSTLLSIFDPFLSDDGAFFIEYPLLEFVNLYLNEPNVILDVLLSRTYGNTRFTISGLNRQLSFKIEIISSIESYLMAYWEDYDIDLSVENIDTIAKETLAYHIADDEKKIQILELFRVLVRNIKDKIDNPEKRSYYGKSLLGLKDIFEIENWTLQNIENISKDDSYNNLLEKIWPILFQKSNDKLKKLTPKISAFHLCNNWINGISYFELLNFLKENTKYIAGNQLRQLTQENVIDICHSNFSYGFSLIIAAICEILRIEDNEIFEKIIENLNLLQKMIKYGLNTQLAITFYEIGFSDRVLATDLATKFNNFPALKIELIEEMKVNENNFLVFFKDYPSYFENVFKDIIG